ncbi:MAG: LPS export ABC transporter periplasmic protein LptC [Armatimonadetes bacterium]|nr:LPS export ABC transporter periplasmic protein LptC [Armatimonadota bacterium]
MRKSLTRVSYAVGAIIVAVAFARILSKWSHPRAPRTGTGNPTVNLADGSHKKIELGNVVIEGPHLTGWDTNGKPLWEAWARRVEFSDKDQQVRLVQAHGVYYENGAKTSSFSAGVISMRTSGDPRRLLHMTNEVTARWNARGISLQSKSLEWDFDQKRISGRAGIQVFRDQWKLTGREVVADLSMKRVRITGDARFQAVS